MRDNLRAETADIVALKLRATNMRRHILKMARGPGQGYVGQGLGIADVLAALYFHELRYNPQDSAGSTVTASSSRPAIIRLRSGRRSPSAESCRWMNSRPMGPMTAGSR